MSLTGGTLLLSGTTPGDGASDRLKDLGGVTLGGGKLQVADGFGNGLHETMGALTLSENSTLDFGTSAGTVFLTFDFNNTAFGGYTPGKTLTINNWTGTANVAGGQDRFLLTNLNTPPDQDFLNNIFFSTYAPGAAAISFAVATRLCPSLSRRARR